MLDSFPQHPDAPKRGSRYGMACDCPCHSDPSVEHFAPCCSSDPDDFIAREPRRAEPDA